MNELIDSDAEIYGADTEDKYNKNKRLSRRAQFKNEMSGSAANMPGVLSATQATDK